VGTLKRLSKPPDYLSEQQKTVWKHLAKIVNAMSVTTKADVIAFERLVSAFCLLRQAEGSLYAHGNTSTVYAEKTSGGTRLAQRPEVAQIAMWDKQLALWMTRFGMTPADRSRVSELGSGKSKANPLAEFGGGAR